MSFKSVIINMAGHQNTSNSSSAFFSRGRHQKICPISAGTAESTQLEVRPKRFLRIQHFNARPRDPKFEKEMQMQQMYRKQGIAAAGGPLTMPKRRPVREASTLNQTSSSTVLPNSVSHNTAGTSAGREISASGSKGYFTTPSNVHVTLKNSEAMLPAPGNQANEEENNSGNSASELKSSNPAGQTEQIEAVKGEDVSASSTNETAIQTTPRHLEQSKRDSVPAMNGILTPRTPSTVLFFFHGVGGSSDVWQAQIRHFAKEGYEIVAPDLIGHGMSCTPKSPKPYTFSEIAADMEEIFDKYCKKKNILIGHSYGCSFAVLLARRRSRRVHKLVLISGGAPTPLAPQPGIFSMPSCLLGCLRPCLNHGFHSSAFHKKRKPVVDKEEAFSIPTYVLQHTMNGQIWPDGDEVYHQWLLCSTLLIYGAQDKLVTLDEEKHMEEVIYHSRLEVISDASHMVMIEAPDDVNTLLADFFIEDSNPTTKRNSPLPTVEPSPMSPRPPLDRSISRMSMKSRKSHKAMPSHFT